LPAHREIIEIRQRCAEAGLSQHCEPARSRPQHEPGAAVGALEGRAFVAGRLVKMLLVRRRRIDGLLGLSWCAARYPRPTLHSMLGRSCAPPTCLRLTAQPPSKIPHAGARCRDAIWV